ncbi:MAG: sel1 repeat family protein [Gammaproteobacteria bacterium]|nr:sel1 repeat family protein [Gammaproteobacteria bacterium]MBU1733501.1 sel1 repeat family protein [Gammaproteobacteria bacterium]MBU1891918.1 sel1 repeat family protein [Gammaproteobacteria bacterium]
MATISIYPPHIIALREDALAGDADAQNDLGDLYREGNGVRHDLSEALRWYRMAADQGDPYGQNNLGSMYFNGLGVPYNPEEAVKWYRLAAAQNVPVAQFNLGVCYRDGEGAPRDLSEAAQYFKPAAEAGHPDAKGECIVCGGSVADPKGKAGNPKLVLLPGKEAFDAESIATLYKDLTGKDVTPEQLARGRVILEKGKDNEQAPSC